MNLNMNPSTLVPTEASSHKMSLYSCQFCSFVLNAGSSLFNLKQHEDKCKARPDDYDPDAEEASPPSPFPATLPSSSVVVVDSDLLLKVYFISHGPSQLTAMSSSIATPATST